MFKLNNYSLGNLLSVGLKSEWNNLLLLLSIFSTQKEPAAYAGSREKWILGKLKQYENFL